MANYGNTGQRYKLSTLVGVERDGEKLLHRLLCGHDYQSWGYSSIEEGYQRAVKRIGTKQRCSKCE